MGNEPIGYISSVNEEVPGVVILRLPQYVRALTDLKTKGVDVVRSKQLGDQLQMTPAQIRKDLSYFGRFGKQGSGYNIKFLLRELREILGLTVEWRACLVGVGRLGRAIINYTGFAPEGFQIVAAFDINDKKVGTHVGENKVLAMHEIAKTISSRRIAIGIVAVPSTQAQSVINALVAGGIQGILNYAPIAPKIPPGIIMRNVDPVLSLQSMTFHLKDK